MFCFHKYSKREKDGYQYCEKCGKANELPCLHVWKLIKEITVYSPGVDMKNIKNSVPQYLNRLYECKFCGEPMVKRVG